jgi:hypothetical protein
MHCPDRWPFRTLLPDPRRTGERPRNLDRGRHHTEERFATITTCNAASARPACSPRCWSFTRHPGPYEREVRIAISGNLLPLHRLSRHRQSAVGRCRTDEGWSKRKRPEHEALEVQVIFDGRPQPDVIERRRSTAGYFETLTLCVQT